MNLQTVGYSACWAKKTMENELLKEAVEYGRQKSG